MKTQYEINGYIKHAEEDSWENGCDPTSGNSFFGDTQFKADSIEKLITYLCQHCGAERDAVTLDACEEPGRIDIQVMENGEGYHASNPEMESFRKGNCRLWLADYSFQVEKVTRETISLNIE